MANPNVTRGLIPRKYFDGKTWNGAANVYFVGSGDTNNLFIGDPIALASAGGTTNTTSSSPDGTPVATIATAAGTNKIVGSMVGIVSAGTPIIPVTRDLNIFRVSAVATYILVADDPELLFEVVDDASTQTTFGTHWAGKNASLVSGSGSTITGYSGWQLAGSTVASGSNLQLKIMRALDVADNTIAGAAVGATNGNQRWLVKINIHQYADSTNGV